LVLTLVPSSLKQLNLRLP